MEPLPYIDEHSHQIDAAPEAVWAALVKFLRGMGGSSPLARVLGCDPAQGTADFAGRVGDAVPGFRVVEAEPGLRMELRRPKSARR